MIPRPDDPSHPAPPQDARRRRLGLAGAVVVIVVAVVAATVFAWPESTSARNLIDDLVALQAEGDEAERATLRGRLIPPTPFAGRVRTTGWRPVAVRDGEVDGRAVLSVVWEKAGRRVVHSVLDGAPVGRPDGSGRTGRSGVLLYSLPGDLRNAVTWTEQGRTAVISGADISVGDLYDLAGGPARRGPA